MVVMNENESEKSHPDMKSFCRPCTLGVDLTSMSRFGKKPGSISLISRRLGRSIPNLFIVLLLSFFIFGIVNAKPVENYRINKRSFFDLKCKGVFQVSAFARLDRVCNDCYNLFREPELESLCRNECFTSDFFKGCIDVLLIEGEELDTIKTYVKQIRGADPLFNEEIN